MQHHLPSRALGAALLTAVLVACGPSGAAAQPGGEQQTNLGQRVLSDEARASIAASLADRHASYDEEEEMLRDTLERVTYRYHTTIEEGEVHRTRASLAYALDLLDTGQEPYRDRAARILRRVIALQDQDPQSDYYGVWPYFLEEPIAQMSPPDRNWADFNGVTLLQVVQDHGHRLPDSLVADLDAALGRATEAVRRRDVGPGYTNIAIMGTFVTLAVAERLGDADLREYGMERLRRFYDFTVENDQAFSEYNSPTYTPVALRELGRMRTYLEDPEVRRLVEPLYRWAWEEVAYHWHAPSREWAGPHSRSYGTLLGDGVRGLVQRASDGRIDFGVAGDSDRIPLPLPRDLEPYFTRLEAPRTFVRELAEGGPALTTYLHPAFALGTASHSMLWNQRRALVAYWGTPEAPSYLHLRFLHDGYDLAAAQLFAEQEGGDVLAGIALATDGGDRHPSLDRIEEATIRARSLRLRLELGGAAGQSVPEQPRSLHEPVRLRFGDVSAWVAVPYAAFGDLQPRWEAGQDDETAWLDLVLYEGEERAFDLAALERALVGLALRIGADEVSAPEVEVREAPGAVQMRWSGLALTLPLRPAERRELEETVADTSDVGASAGGASADETPRGRGNAATDDTARDTEDGAPPHPRAPEGGRFTDAVAGPEWAKHLPLYEVNLGQYPYPEGEVFERFQAHLPVLKEMGVGILWFMPIHPKGVEKAFGSPYAVRDFYGINPAYGTEEDLRRLVARAHELGLRVIIDWVANHTSWDNELIRTHPAFYERDEDGNVKQAGPWRDVAQLDYGNRALWEYMREAMTYWVEAFDVDGFRCDVAWGVPLAFWNWLRPQLDEAGGVFMLAEANEPELHEAFDATYDWDLPPVMWQIAAAERPATALDTLLQEERAAYPDSAVRLRFISNHDWHDNANPGVYNRLYEEGVLKRLDESATVYDRYGGGVEAFMVLCATLPGKLLVYNGQEMGSGAAAPPAQPEARRGSPAWAFYRDLLRLARESPALYEGDFVRVASSRSRAVYAFVRRRGPHQVLVVLNLSGEPQAVTLQSGVMAGEYTELFTEGQRAFARTGELQLEPWGYRVYVRTASGTPKD